MHAFIAAVENLLPFLEAMEGTPFESIRAQITGYADQVLGMNGTPLSWSVSKANLIAYYNDKRDSVMITRDMF